MLDYVLGHVIMTALECFDNRSYHELFIYGCKYTAVNTLVEQLCYQIVFRRISQFLDSFLYSVYWNSGQMMIYIFIDIYFTENMRMFYLYSRFLRIHYQNHVSGFS